MKFILGRKQNMTQVFDESGKVVPATVISAGPMTAVSKKTVEKDGYEAIVFGYGAKKEKNVKKPQRKLGNFAFLKEFKNGSVEIGSVVDASVFENGDKITVSGISKGKGFQGVVKRHGFKGGPRTHGQKHSEREPGSIGGGLRTRVPKGMRMAGRMGSDRITVKNLRIVKVDKDNNQLFVLGAVPGRKGTLLEIKGN
ncbi:TPA: 50S ribosomal protein L3 [Patescibacteria group bacterium]|nr:MAG: 50S ribosomal protein L3 [Parcubacteria group bacterium GW2011_GWF2_40_10]KKR47405.1 MAG: 50S ribosomal protein L3 [Parcubacteria group bacterium GW2011_GWA2_40_143]KKR59805.1 MAG: 50S ribosomal protein L3 [Parcubacteria group bacterium GW2011_GWC2_40_31]KKR77205.1 MAG: 50S ribosomal protein L3 [Parcubacteria group bacterium GW2011_GWE2_40_8]KKR82120.1 MAG: 50S ribosomal protein L3 [Parcubacteria group bacterium GW2011_GWD2_40_9]HBB56637.1 50S ribosomal protein L3 [Patescibacteria grou